MSYPIGRHEAYDNHIYALLDGSDVKDMVLQWRQNALNELSCSNPNVEDQEDAVKEHVFIANNLLSIFLSRGEGCKTDIRTAVFDLKLATKLSLSDLFFDGANYIDYINSSLFQRSLREGGESLGMFGFNEEYFKRSFSGLPADYPYFVVPETGTLSIAFPGSNPFVIVPEFQSMFLADIELAHQVSPWCKIQD